MNDCNNTHDRHAGPRRAGVCGELSSGTTRRACQELVLAGMLAGAWGVPIPAVAAPGSTVANTPEPPAEAVESAVPGLAIWVDGEVAEAESIRGTEVDVWFTNVDTGDFTLTPEGAATFANIAEWNTGGSPTDILGTSRPVVDGTSDYAGAHHP